MCVCVCVRYITQTEGESRFNIGRERRNWKEEKVVVEEGREAGLTGVLSSSMASLRPSSSSIAAILSLWTSLTSFRVYMR